MELKKKAVFFTFVAIIFLSLLIFSTSIGLNYKLRQKTLVLETRVDTMNRFIIDVEEDLERGAYISGVRAFFELTSYIVSSGDYIPNLDASFSELIVNGTIEGNVSERLVNNTITHWMDRITEEGEKIDLLINFTIRNTSLYHEDPWYVTVEMGVGMEVNDKEGLSSWTRENTIKSAIEIYGFEDPVYWIGTSGSVQNQIVRANLTYFVIGNDTTNLESHTENGHYVAFTDAPSYLMRMQGNFSNSTYGIESLVDIDRLVDAGVTPLTKTIVDYFYFGLEDPVFYHVSGLDTWFRVDNETNFESNQTHLELYEVEDIAS